MLIPLLVGIVVVGLVGALIAGARTPSTIDLQVEDDALVVRITGKDALYAMCRGMRIPLDSIQGIAVAPRRNVPATGLRMPGTGIPGMLRAGSFGTGEQRDFWLVRGAPEVLVVELQRGEPYRRLVLELPDPRETCLRLRPLTGSYTGTFTA